MTLFEELTRRGLIAQMSHPAEIEKTLNTEKVSFYIGFDATADSLHAGHLLQLITMKRFQNAGHKPLALLGTGTTVIGDPSGKSDMRKMLDNTQIEYNAARFGEQMGRFLNFDNDNAEVLKNGEWLLKLNYLEFLRDVGSCFSVNKMLSAECFKARLEKGLSFIEFNYMLLQSYDFLHLYRTKNVKFQLGGDDQWSNILAGADLIRRKEQGEAFALTFKLLLTKEGKKMGKTEKGALWLDAEKCSPYDFFQYFRNVDDGDVINCLKLLTFVPIEEIEKIEADLNNPSSTALNINQTKELLAFEITKLVHGEGDAKKALDAAKAVFGGGTNNENMPTFELNNADLTEGKISIVDLLLKSGMVSSKRDARTNIEQGGVVFDSSKVTDVNFIIDFSEKKSAVLQKGKKTFKKIVSV